jgi:hypothetical protein
MAVEVWLRSRFSLLCLAHGVSDVPLERVDLTLFLKTSLEGNRDEFEAILIN